MLRPETELVSFIPTNVNESQHDVTDCVSARQLIMQCGHVTYVRIFVYIIYIYGAALLAFDSAEMVPVCGVNFCWYDAMTLELSPLNRSVVHLN